jgi:hypothetical protein
MTAPLKRVRKQPPTVFPTEKDFEKFKPLLEVYLRQWFEFVASVPSGTDAGQIIISGGTGGTVFASGKSQFSNTSNTLFIAVPGIPANAIVSALVADNAGGSAPKIWCQSVFATSGFTLYQDTTTSLFVDWVVVKP